MKDFLMIFVLLAICFTSFGQVPEKANTIIVPATLHEAASFLEKEGYTVLEPNVNLGNFSTEAKKVKLDGGREIMMKVSVFTQGELVKLTANFRPDPDNVVKREQACYCGSEGSTHRQIFKELNRLAQALSEEKVVYAVQ